jgi:hypothetical protein
MMRPLLFRGNFELVSEVTLVVGAAGLAEEIGPTVGAWPTSGCNCGMNPKETPKAPLATGGTALDLPHAPQNSDRTKDKCYGGNCEYLPRLHSGATALTVWLARSPPPNGQPVGIR